MGRSLCCLFTVASALDDDTILLQSRHAQVKRHTTVTELSDELEHLATALKTRGSASEALSQHATVKVRELVEQVQKMPSGIQQSYSRAPSFQEVFEPLSESEREALLVEVLSGTELTDAESTVTGKKFNSR